MSMDYSAETSTAFDWYSGGDDVAPALPQPAATVAAAALVPQDGAARRVQPDPDGIVTLPAGTDISTIVVQGRDLVVPLPDGTRLIIVDGAVFVPELVIGQVEVPQATLVALLIGHEPAPAAITSSSGGNFAVAVGTLGDGFAIGDLLPPTQLAFTVPTVQDLEPDVRRLDADPDTLPEVSIVTPQTPTGATSASATVSEAGLPARGAEPAGSNAASTLETTTGTVNYVATDTPSTVAVNGTAVTGVGQSIVAQYGTLAITAIRPGAFDYSYTLSDNTTGDVSDVVTVVVTDRDGDTAQATLTIAIVDDVPTAVNDLVTQPVENAPVVINAFANDVFGADGVDIDNAPTTRVTFGQGANGGAVAYNPATGLFTYTPTAGQAGTDNFTYTIVDGDGDASTATVTVQLLADSTPGVTVTGAAQVFEAGLPGGSNAAATSETTTGTIAVATGGDTLASLFVNGVNVTAGGTVTGASGTLTVTLANGVYGYGYTLTAPTAGDATTDPFAITATDSDGDTAQGTLIVRIVDDVPTAVADIDRVSAPVAPASATTTVNVDFTTGTFLSGVPAGSTQVALNGATLSSNNGALSFYRGASVLSASDARPGEAFTREIDGANDQPESVRVAFAADQAQVRLSIGQLYRETIVSPTPDAERVTVIVGLADGSSVTRTVAATSTQEPGEVFVTLNAADFGGRLIRSVELTPDLTGPNLPDTLTPAQRAQYENLAYSEFVLRGVSYDVPAAAATAPFADGNVLTGIGGTDANASDGVADVRGADGATVTGVVAGNAVSAAGNLGTALAGTYGTLTLSADGSYRYTPSASNAELRALVPSETRTDTFTYTITDGDGDTSTTTLIINIDGSDDPVAITGLTSGILGGDIVVDEASLAGGTTPGATATTQVGDFTVTAPDGYGTISVAGQVILSGGTFTPATITTPLGNTLSVTGFDPATGQVRYSYALNGAADSTGADRATESFAVVATDRNGTTATAALGVTILDDAPQLVADTDGVRAGTPMTTTTETRTVDFSDASLWTGVPAGSTQLALGGVTLQSINGALTYYRGASVLSPGDLQPGQRFTVEIDRYNDQPEGVRLVFQEAQSLVRVTVGELYQERLFRTTPDAEKVTVSVTLDDGTVSTRTVAATALVSPGDVRVTLAAADFGGHLIQAVTLVPDPSTPTLTPGVRIPASQQANATSAYSDFVLKGVEYQTTATTPAARTVADGNVLTGVGGTDANGTDGAADRLGADGAQVTGIGVNFESGSGVVGTPLAGTYGTLTIAANGDYSYVLNNDQPRVAALSGNASLNDRFTYAVTDGDGDRASTTLTITIRAPLTGGRFAATAETASVSVAAVEQASARMSEATTTAGLTAALVATAVVATAAAETHPSTNDHATVTADPVPAATAGTVAPATPASVAPFAASPMASGTPENAGTAHHGDGGDTARAAHIDTAQSGVAGTIEPVADAHPATPEVHDAVAIASAPAAAFIDASAIPVAAIAPPATAAQVSVSPTQVAGVLSDVLHGGAPADAPAIDHLLAALPASPAGAVASAEVGIVAVADAGAGHDMAAAWAAMADAAGSYAAATAGHDGVVAVAHAA